MKKIILWISIIITIIILVIVFLNQSNKKSEKPKETKNTRPQLKINAVIVQPKLLFEEITVSGTILAYDEVDLKNEVPGRIVAINLPEGQPVQKGTLLVKLYDDDLQANLSKLKSQLAIQEQIYQARAELLKIDGISKNEFDQTVLQINAIKADIKIEEVRIRKTEIIAPFDGVIGLRNVSLGAQLTTATTVATIRTDKQMKLDFSVPEKYSHIVQKGQTVKFTIANSTKPENATVMATEQGIEANTRNLKVRAIVDNPSTQVLPGAYANVTLRLNEKIDAITIPTQAIIPKEENKMVIIAKNGHAHFANIKTGIRQASNIEVTEGLKKGDTIVTSGILFLKQGDILSFANIKTDE